MYPSTDPRTCQEVLHDVTAAGREQPWAQHKAEAQLVALALWDRATPTAARMHACADTLFFQRREGGELRLRNAHFCRARLCPVCQWRRSLKCFGQVSLVVSSMQAQRSAAGLQPWRWLLITLTVRNCSGCDLSATLDLLQSGWGRMSRRRRWQRAVRGSFRAIEITYNRSSGTYHPHMHILCAVLPSYFSSRDYIPQGELIEMWRHCAKRRFAAWGGIMRQLHHELGQDDSEDGDLVHLSGDAAESDAGAYCYAWDWYAGPRLYLRAPDKEGFYDV